MLFYTFFLVVMVSASCDISDWIEIDDSLFLDEVSDDYLDKYAHCMSFSDDHCYRSEQKKQNLIEVLYAPDIMYVRENERKAMICDSFIVKIIKSTDQGKHDVKADGCLVSFLQDVQRNLDNDVVDIRVYVYILKRVYHKLLGNTTDKVFELPQDDRFAKYEAKELIDRLEKEISVNSCLQSKGVLVLKGMLQKVETTLLCRTGETYQNRKRPVYRYSYNNDKQPEKRLNVVDMWLECLRRTLSVLIGNWKSNKSMTKGQKYKMATVVVFPVTDSKRGVVGQVCLLKEAKLFDRNNNRAIGKKGRRKRKGVKNATKETKSGCLRPKTRSNNAPKVSRPVVLGLVDRPQERLNPGKEQNDTSRTQLANNRGTVPKNESVKWLDRQIIGNNQGGSSTGDAYHGTNIGHAGGSHGTRNPEPVSLSGGGAVSTSGSHGTRNPEPAPLSGEGAIAHVSEGNSTDDTTVSGITDQPEINGTTNNGTNDSFLAHANAGSNGTPGMPGSQEDPDADAIIGIPTLADDVDEGLADRPTSSL